MVTLTRALRARRARPPEVPEKAPYLAALQPRAKGSGQSNITLLTRTGDADSMFVLTDDIRLPSIPF